MRLECTRNAAVLLGMSATLSAQWLNYPTPGLILILNEIGTSYRQIFTDGRPLPVNPQPAWSGYSTGHWEGDTLVVEINGFRDGTWLDRNGSPLTESAKMTERFRRVNYGHLEVEINVDDPKAYTGPFTVKLN